MEEIRRLIDATPTVFHQVLATTNNDDKTCRVQCQVEPGSMDEDEVLDMYQAIIDICVRHIAQDSYKSASVDLEYPNECEIDITFDLAERLEVHKKTPTLLRMQRMYFDTRENNYRTYVFEESL